MKTKTLKRLIALLIAVAFIPAQLCISHADGEEFAPGESYKLEVIAELPVGDGEGQISFDHLSYPGGGSIAPNGDIFIKNGLYKFYPPHDGYDRECYDSELLQFNSEGEYIRTFDHELFCMGPDAVSGEPVCFCEEYMYVTGNFGAIHKFNLETMTIEDTLYFPVGVDGAAFIVSQVEVDGYVAYIPGDDQPISAFNVADEEFVLLSDIFERTYNEAEGTVTISMLNRTHTFADDRTIDTGWESERPYNYTPLGYDDDGNIIVSCGQYHDGQVFKKFSPSGECLGVAGVTDDSEYMCGFFEQNGDLRTARYNEETNMYELCKVIFNESFFADNEGTFDFNFDGEENTGDAAHMLLHFAGISSVNPAVLMLADVNGDGYANTGDVCIMLRSFAG